MLADHIHRMLSVVFAVNDGTSLAHIEEFAREKDLALDIAALEETLRTQQTLLTAFALLHDIAKPDVAFFDARPESKGAAEGFVQHALRGTQVMTEAERLRYDKLLRAYDAAHPRMTAVERMGGFFDTFGITVHYDRHDALAASTVYAKEREALAAHLGLSLSQGKMLVELIRYHIDAIRAFCDRADATAYKTLAARAGKAGLNTEQFLDLAIAALFLDAVAGSVQYKEGRFCAQTSLVINMLRAERDAMPARHAAREFAAKQSVKQAYKALLAEAALDGESIFRLLGTPLGPVRGDVMRRVQTAIDDPTASHDFGPHSEELARRIAKFHALQRMR